MRYSARVDVVAFLARHPPFDSLDPDDLSHLSHGVTVERYPAGAVILRQAGEPSRFLYVVREGAVEILDDERPIDLMGEGELFGEWSLLAGSGPSATVRAHEDTECYLIDRLEAERLLGSQQGLAFIARAMHRRVARATGRDPEAASTELRSVGSMVNRPQVTCPPDTPVTEAAALMTRERISCLLIPRDGGWGILTDRDLRSRVVAAGRGFDTPIETVASFPVGTVPEDTPAVEVLLRMLEGGFHHFPVTDPEGRVTGVVTDTDLMGIGRHSPFTLKSSIERAATREDVIETARGLPDTVASLVDSSVDPVDIGHVVGLTIDALTRRLIALAIEKYGEPPVPWAWLALGSAARQEQALHTDQDHALAYESGGRTVEEIDPYFAEFTEFVTAGLEASGIPRCEGDVMASNSELRKSVEGWVEAFHSWMVEPGRIGSMLLSIVFDYRRVDGPLDIELALDAEIRSARQNVQFMHHLARRALDHKPPTGFFRDFVVEGKGDHAGRLDIKHGGITIIGNLARTHSIGAGLSEKRTIPRLRAAAVAGALDAEEAMKLEEAFTFLWEVRLEHQAAQLRAGVQVDDFVDPATLGPVTRRGLKEAFRIIAQAQKSLGLELGVRLR